MKEDPQSSSEPGFVEYLKTLNQAAAAAMVTDAYEGSISLVDGCNRATQAIKAVRASGGTVYVVGNGGSASIASHLQNDLVKAAGMKAIVLTEAPLLTAYTNDDGYATAYASPLKLWAQKGDLLVAISSSGESENILRAVAVAQEAGAEVITLSGFAARNTLRRTGDLNFYIPSPS